jgi:hypothetical protein
MKSLLAFWIAMIVGACYVPLALAEDTPTAPAPTETAPAAAAPAAEPAAAPATPAAPAADKPKAKPGTAAKPGAAKPGAAKPDPKAAPSAKAAAKPTPPKLPPTGAAKPAPNAAAKPAVDPKKPVTRAEMLKHPVLKRAASTKDEATKKWMTAYAKAHGGTASWRTPEFQAELVVRLDAYDKEHGAPIVAAPAPPAPPRTARHAAPRPQPPVLNADPEDDRIEGRPALGPAAPQVSRGDLRTEATVKGDCQCSLPRSDSRVGRYDDRDDDRDDRDSRDSRPRRSSYRDRDRDRDDDWNGSRTPRYSAGIGQGNPFLNNNPFLQGGQQAPMFAGQPMQLGGMPGPGAGGRFLPPSYAAPGGPGQFGGPQFGGQFGAQLGGQFGRPMMPPQFGMPQQFGGPGGAPFFAGQPIGGGFQRPMILGGGYQQPGAQFGLGFGLGGATIYNGSGSYAAYPTNGGGRALPPIYPAPARR